MSDNTKDDEYSVGFFRVYYNVLCEDALGSFKPDNNRLYVKVYSNEGPIPHFHIMTKDKSFETCVRLDSAKYFNHGHIKGKLNTKQIKALVSFLNKKSPKHNGKTIFEIIVMAWNISTDNKTKLSLKSTKMPDYIKLNKNDEGGK